MSSTDPASYSDIVFGLLTLEGFAYAPRSADLSDLPDPPDQKLGRVDRTADYGAFRDATRGRSDLARIERRREDIPRVLDRRRGLSVSAFPIRDDRVQLYGRGHGIRTRPPISLCSACLCRDSTE